MSDDLTLADLPQPVEETTVHPDELHVDGDNPNEQSEETFGLLCDNMRAKGWLGNAIVADTDGCIADGEHRWRAAQEIGLTEVPVKFYDIDDAERRLWRQELNKIAGEHDSKRDALEYDHLLGEGYTEEVEALTDAANEDLDELLAELRVEAGQSPAYEYDPDHNVYFEDCVKGMRERLDDDSVDCVITDPPYGWDFTGRPEKENDHASIANADDWEMIEGAFSELARAIRPGHHVYSFWSYHHYGQFEKIFRRHFNHHNTLVWVKESFGLQHSNHQYRPQHEFILYGTAPTTSDNAKPRRLDDSWNLSDVLEYPRPDTAEYDHPTEKPMALLADLLTNSTDEGDRVLDPFMGSGTTAVAAIRNDRDYVGFEVDEDNYREVIERRIGEAKRQRDADVNNE